jgi:hypothetical protein
MKSPGERMEYYIKRILRISVPDFASLLGVQDKTVYNIIHDDIQSVIGKSTLEDIFRMFPKFPWDWVRTGEGPVPDEETAERAVIERADSEALKLRDKEIDILKKRIFYLEKQEDAAMKNSERLEKQIEWLEEQLKECKEKKS